MASTFVIKRGDQEPKLRATLKNADNTPIDLTAATALSFVMKNVQGGGGAIKAAGTFIDRPNGVVEYAWAIGDTATSGVYNAEFEISWGGRLQTVPNSIYFQVQVVDDLG